MNTTHKTLLATAFLGLLFILGSFFPVEPNAHAFRTEEEMNFIRTYGHELRGIDSLKFTTATVCEGCHGNDPLGIAMVDEAGNDINVFDDWQSSMMANSTKDPFWRAKVSHEIEVNPVHSEALQHKCTSCHAPLGHYKALLEGVNYYTLEDLDRDTVGLDGVNCGACHQLSPEGLGNTFSGNLNYDTNKVMFGPYPFPFDGPMTDFIGFQPVFGPHVLDSELCAGCHTLIVAPFDLDGEPTGDTYVEQATYHEWVNSRYATENISCQNCHIPRIDDDVVIASGLFDLDPRSPFGLHEMVGGNSFMLQLMKEHKDSLGIKASDADYDATIDATFKLLSNTLNLGLDDITFDGDTLEFTLRLNNKAGHKFPSGYPARRAILELVLESFDGDTLFHSGQFAPDYSLLHEDVPYEPHHQIITKEDQVQIYEIVPADVEGNFTTLLAQAVSNLKDNRLPPEGFTRNHPVYDTVGIFGQANIDPDFNVENAMEGSGTDFLKFRIPVNSDVQWAKATAKVHYQAVPRKWVQNMFQFDTEAINRFETMYDSADHVPALVADAVLDSILLDPTSIENQGNIMRWSCWPNPVASGQSLHIDTGTKRGNFILRVYSLSGNLVKQQILQNSTTQVTLDVIPGVYMIQITDQTTRRMSSKRLVVH